MLALCHLSTGFSQELDEILEAEGFTLISSNDSTSFWLSEYPSSFVLASDAAEAFGGHLATFSSLEENDAVWQALQGVPVIFGLTLQEEWTWVTGEPLSWTKWDTSQPTLNGENSGHLRPNGKWNDVTDDYAGYRWLLEIPLVSIQGGCTHFQACNYDSTVLFENGTCEYVSCHCLEGTIWNENLGGCVGSVSADLDFDGCVGMSDLLNLLSVFGTCAESELAEWTCGDPLEYQGYDYSTVLIGEQCWFAENLRAEAYANGDEIASQLSEEEWGQTSQGATAIFGEGDSYVNGSGADEEFNLPVHGRLYNGFAVQDSRGLCPSGWSVSATQDWTDLRSHLEVGGLDSLGVELRTASTWNSSGDMVGRDSQGLSWKGSGNRMSNGHFNNMTIYGEFRLRDCTCWAETGYGAVDFWVEPSDPKIGASVRCIKDPQ